jgi:hypothetical protein
VPSLRAKRSNPSHHAKKEWIASSQALLATTEKGLYSASDQAIAFFSVDCRVKLGHDELGLTDGI